MGQFGCQLQAKLKVWLSDFALPAIEMYFVREGFIAGKDIEQYLGVEGTRAMVGLVSVFEPEKRLDLLKRALEETHLPALQQAAIEFWVQNEVEATQVALQNLSRLSGESQAILLSQMAKRLETAKLFISALVAADDQPTQIAADVWRQLASYQNDDLQRGLALGSRPPNLPIGKPWQTNIEKPGKNQAMPRKGRSSSKNSVHRATNTKALGMKSALDSPRFNPSRMIKLPCRSPSQVVRSILNSRLINGS